MNKDFAFHSERLTYRGIRKSDAELISKWRSNPDNYKNFFNPRPVSIEEHLAWFEKYLDDETRYDFMIIDQDENRIGTVGLSNIDQHSCEISYMIGDESARGKGFAIEAVNAATELAFRELGVSEVLARILPHNEASFRVVSGSGYTECERVFKRKTYERDS